MREEYYTEQLKRLNKSALDWVITDAENRILTSKADPGSDYVKNQRRLIDLAKAELQLRLMGSCRL